MGGFFSLWLLRRADQINTGPPQEASSIPLPVGASIHVHALMAKLLVGSPRTRRFGILGGRHRQIAVDVQDERLVPEHRRPCPNASSAALVAQKDAVNQLHRRN